MSSRHATSAVRGASSKRLQYSPDYPTVRRCMAFADVSSFTNYTHRHGSHAAAQMVSDFRDVVRTTTGRHGVRVARWLGDGVMLVGIETRPMIETLRDIAEQCKEEGIPLHCGLATGEVIIFEGDDYIGRTINIASRLAQTAKDSELCAYNIDLSDVPRELDWDMLKDTTVKGVGMIDKIILLHLV